MVNGIIRSLALGMLYSVFVLTIFRRREIIEVLSARPSAFEPNIKANDD
jgi:hypothetical protein